VVTGAESGIGRSTVLRIIAEDVGPDRQRLVGAHAVVSERNASPLTASTGGLEAMTPSGACLDVDRGNAKNGGLPGMGYR
jgi:NAD(P)-dependent dehydrogenase (short-subunit alcohol dehydrogenase family)